MISDYTLAIIEILRECTVAIIDLVGIGIFCAGIYLLAVGLFG